MIKVGVIGYGYWGPNIVRTLMQTKNAVVKTVCDIDIHRLNAAKKAYPAIEVTQDYKQIIKSNDIDVVAIVTPVSMHYRFAKLALEHGKHIFVEKPFTAKVRDAEMLIQLAKKKKRMIMVDHTFIFTGAVQKIKEIIDTNELGNLYYYDSMRLNLGLFQQDVNVIWDLAPHDLSIIDYLIKAKPVAITANGIDLVKGGQENMAFITIYFDNSFLAHINVNWLSPVKIRHTLIGGEKKMLVWNDLDADEKIKIYNKGVKIHSKETINRIRVEYRMGDMLSPRIDHTEALNREMEHLVDCLTNNKRPINDGESGLRVVKMLEATNASLKSHGKKIKV